MRELNLHITGYGAPALGAARATAFTQSDMRGTTALIGRFTIVGVEPKTRNLVAPTIPRRPSLE